LGEITIELSHERGHVADSMSSEERPDSRVDVIRVHVKLSGNLDDEQAGRLRIIAGRCPIHRMLEATPDIIDEFEVVPG
jgi:putative redox protein